MGYLYLIKNKYKEITKYIGTMLIGVGISLLIPLLILPIYSNEINQAIYFLIPSIISLIVGFSMRLSTKDRGETTLNIQEGGIIVVFSWIITIAISAIPFIISGQLTFTQAIFESVSGWTTTGLSVIDVTKTSNLFLLWRSIMQFFGGAGLAVVMLSAIIGPYGLGLYNAEGRTDKLLPNITKSTKLIMVIYLGYIVAGVIMYIVAGMNWFDAINHSIAAISTGGFSTKAGSIGEYNSVYIELITIVLMLLGTINFAAHFVLLKGQVKSFFKIGEIKFMFFLLSLSIPFVSVFSLRKLYGSLGESIRVSMFEIISALSTTGFSTVGYTEWNSFGIFILIILMFIGGGAGSTAGGLKQYRVYVMLKSLIWDIRNYLLPKRIVKEDYIIKPEGKYYVTKNHIIQTGTFVTIYIIFHIIGTLVLLAHGYSISDSMFEMASSLSTVGLSIGITSPDAPIAVLWTQIFGMFLGRLEFFVVFFSLAKIYRDFKLAIKK